MRIPPDPRPRADFHRVKARLRPDNSGFVEIDGMRVSCTRVIFESLIGGPGVGKVTLTLCADDVQIDVLNEADG